VLLSNRYKVFFVYFCAAALAPAANSMAAAVKLPAALSSSPGAKTSAGPCEQVFRTSVRTSDLSGRFFRLDFFQPEFPTGFFNRIFQPDFF
jgi:hypothetical protein